MKQFLSLILSLSFILNAISQNQLGNDIDGEFASDFFGRSVAISSNGNQIIVGSRDNSEVENQSGHARIFEWTGSAWQQLGNDIDGAAEDDALGHAVSISADGSRIAVGATQSFAFDVGYVKVFDWDGTSWNQVGSTLVGGANGDQFGYAIALSSDGNRLAAGAIGTDVNGGSSGQARVFKWNGAAWQQVGQNINGSGSGVNLGVAIDIANNGNSLIVGAEESDGKGSVQIYDYNGIDWVQRGTSIAGDSGFNLFGSTLELADDGNRFISGALFNDTAGNDAGQAKIFEWNGTNWVQLGSDLYGENAEDQFGSSVSMSSDGSRIAIGARFHSTMDGNFFGKTYSYDWNGSAWSAFGNTILGEAAGDGSGNALSLSNDGNRLIIGATGNSDGGNLAGHVRVFQFSTLSTEEFYQDIISVYPNPVNDILYFKPMNDSNFSITDISGKILLQDTSPANSINISHLSSGLYVLHIVAGPYVISKKIIKN